jgi:hypothetical protein
VNREPAGDPISNSISVADDPCRAIAVQALRIIDSIHGDGLLPSIRVSSQGTKNRPAAYIYTTSGRALGIGISPRSQTPLVDFTHEVGHFLDHQAIGEPSAYASPDDRRFEAWRAEVSSSGPITRLRQLAAQTQVKVVLADGRNGFLNIDRHYVNYLLRTREIFFRTYAQFIAEASQDAAMLAEIESLRKVQSGTVHYPVQWSKSEFAGIRDEIERIIINLGWMR